MRCRDGRALHRQLSRPIQRLARRGTEPPWQALFDYWKLPCMLPTWTGRATSINVYLAWDPTSEPQRKKRTRRGFDLCKYLAGKSCFSFQRALPRPRRFFPEARSRHTTAMDGFIWRSPSPPPRSTLGGNACNRTAYQSKARWSGRAAARASISAIPTVTLWSLPRLDCGRSTDEERELRLWCLGGGSGVAGCTVRCADGVARANTPTRSSLGSNVCFGSLAVSKRFPAPQWLGRQL